MSLQNVPQTRQLRKCHSYKNPRQLATLPHLWRASCAMSKPPSFHMPSNCPFRLSYIIRRAQSKRKMWSSQFKKWDKSATKIPKYKMSPFFHSLSLFPSLLPSFPPFLLNPSWCYLICHLKSASVSKEIFTGPVQILTGTQEPWSHKLAQVCSPPDSRFPLLPGPSLAGLTRSEPGAAK